MVDSSFQNKWQTSKGLTVKCVGVIKEIKTDLFYWFKNNQEQFPLFSHFVNSVQSAGLKLRESLVIL